MKSLFAGPSAVARAMGLLAKNPKLIPPILIPALVALALSIVGVWAALRYGPELLISVWPEPEGWFTYGVWWVVTSIVGLTAAVLSLFFTPWLVMLLGLPLCEPLVGRTEAALGDRSVKASLVGEIARTLTTTIGLVIVGLAGAIGLFLLGLIPGVGIVTAPFSAFVWTPMFLALDICDSSMARRQLNLRQKIKLVLSNPLRMWSLGLTAMVLVSLPIINLLGLPLAVMAGVLVVRDLDPGRVGAG